jgi:hypothetical protein
MFLNKTQGLSDGRKLLAWWANNRGRGSNNCTLAIVAAGVDRSDLSAKQTQVQSKTRTSSWRGDVNLSKRVLAELGITKSDIDNRI